MTVSNDTELHDLGLQLMDAHWALQQLSECTPDHLCADDVGFSNGLLLGMVADRMSVSLLAYMRHSCDEIDRLKSALSDVSVGTHPAP